MTALSEPAMRWILDPGIEMIDAIFQKITCSKHLSNTAVQETNLNRPVFAGRFRFSILELTHIIAFRRISKNFEQHLRNSILICVFRIA